MRLLLVLAVIAATSLPAAADTPDRRITCGGEVSGGYAIARARVAGATAGALDFAADGVLLALGGECHMAVGKITAGALARYHVGKAETRVEDVTLEIEGLWTVAGRLGWQIQPTTTFYGIIGWSGATTGATGLADRRLQGLATGLGIDTRLVGPTLLRFEWTRHDFRGVAIEDARLSPVLNLIRAGVVIELN
jgi:hypothetical protein